MLTFSVPECLILKQNHPEQIRLQELFAQYGYFYEIKRGDRKYLDSGKESHNLLKKEKKDFKLWEEKISKKDFIKNKIVKPWLKIILDKLIKEEFEAFNKEAGPQLKHIIQDHQHGKIDRINSRS